ncbi:MAG: nucleotide exchange factor GrpE [Thermoplasmata archaeon]|nr:nucleotide exchange factor GrpE [Thermoplasmata archaeon]
MADDPESDAPAEGGPETVPAAPPGASVPTAPGEDWSTRYKYLLADFENYRRRSERDREGITRQARGGMLRELLPIIEGFRAARDAVGKLPSDDPVRRGMELLDREWSTFLHHEGVEPVVKVGGPFRPEEAEAVGEAIVAEGAPDGLVVEVVQQGYRFFGGLLRPAKVIVGRHPPATTEATVLVEAKSE